MTAECPTILATSMGFNRARAPWVPSPIFNYAFELAGNPRLPKICFISTGTGDKQDSIDNFYAALTRIEVEASHIALFDKPNVPDISAHLRKQDVVWVDRGSVANMLAVWQVHGVDTILRDCWEHGIVLGGESAGSLCWFSGGTTDSFGDVQPFTNGLGFLPFSNAVHYTHRREHFQKHIAGGLLSDGFATDAGAGLHFSGTELVTAISDRKTAAAYKVVRQPDGSVLEEPLTIHLLRRNQSSND